MSDFDFGKMMEGGEVVEPIRNEFEPIAKGRYPLAFTKIVGKRIAKSGVPEGTLLVSVTEGPQKGKSGLVRVYLAASRYISEQNAEGGWDQTEKTQEQYTKDKNATFGRLNALIEALGLPRRVATNIPANNEEYPFAIVGMENWLGREFIADVDSKDGVTNTINNPRAANDPKFGVEVWRNKVLPKQINAGSRVVTGSGLGGI